ncbi:MAG: VCBS repeat-containing protein [Calothrix sp. MO_167.B42]|nr:VCBS repeat-containing protein [Calothrix sp. MO_167.B42]
MARSVIDVTKLSGNEGFIIRDSKSVPGNSGFNGTVRSLGDINGDGRSDITFETSGNVPNDFYGEVLRDDAGIVLGSGHSGIDVANLKPNEGFVIPSDEKIRVDGKPSDVFKTKVFSAGDINNDGVEDMLISREVFRGTDDGTDFAYDYDNTVDVVFGGSNINETGSSKGFSLTLNGSQEIGDFVAAADSVGDVNGDGVEDMMFMGPNSSANIIFGNSEIGANGSVDIGELDGKNGFKISDNANGGNVNLAWTSSGAGDVNGDGFADLIISTNGETKRIPGYDGGSLTYKGRSYVVFGGSEVGGNGTFDPTKINGSNGFMVEGTEFGDSLGRQSVSSAGDVNGDGYDDVLLGSSNGNSYVVFGKADGFNTKYTTADLNNGKDGFTIEGGPSPVSKAGDFNGDGLSDIVVGQGYGEDAYVIYGNKDIGAGGSVKVSEMNGDNGITLKGAGQVIDYAGDVNGDGIDDILTGNHGQTDILTTGKLDPAQGYVIYGQKTGSTTTTGDGMTGDPSEPTSDGTGDILTGGGESNIPSNVDPILIDGGNNTPSNETPTSTGNENPLSGGVFNNDFMSFLESSGFGDLFGQFGSMGSNTDQPTNPWSIFGNNNSNPTNIASPFNNLASNLFEIDD